LSETPERLVTLKQVSLRFGEKLVLDRVDLAIDRGKAVTLVGLNGSGKSTLVRVVLELIRADSGQVWRRPGLRVGYTPQRFKPDPTLPMTVKRFASLGGADAKRVRAGLGEVGAEALIESPVAALSGGELQRVMLARALVRDPDLLVLDEPMSGIDMTGQAELYQLIATIRDRRGCGVLLVSHDLHLVMAATDTVVCLNHHVCCTGQPQAVLRDPAFVSLFGDLAAQSLAIYRHAHDHYHGSAGEVLPIAGAKTGGDSDHQHRHHAGGG